MAFFPCDAGHHVNRGRNVSVYLGELHEHGSTRTKWRLCLTHWHEVEAGLAQFEVDPESITLSGPELDSLCLVCLKPADEITRQLFFTSYPSQDERKDYWARVHDHCSLSTWILKPEWGR